MTCLAKCPDETRRRHVQRPIRVSVSLAQASPTARSSAKRSAHHDEGWIRKYSNAETDAGRSCHPTAVRIQTPTIGRTPVTTETSRWNPAGSNPSEEGHQPEASVAWASVTESAKRTQRERAGRVIEPRKYGSCGSRRRYECGRQHREPTRHVEPPSRATKRARRGRGKSERCSRTEEAGEPTRGTPRSKGRRRITDRWREDDGDRRRREGAGGGRNRAGARCAPGRVDPAASWRGLASLQHVTRRAPGSIRVRSSGSLVTMVAACLRARRTTLASTTSFVPASPQSAPVA